MRYKKPKHIQLYRDRHGKQRIYFRKPGTPLVPLPGPLYSEAFWTAYHKAMAGESLKAVGASRMKAGSLSALIVEYYTSAEYKTLADSTKAAYRRVLDRFRQEHGDKPVALLETVHVNKILDGVADRPAAASNLRDRLSGLMQFAIGAGYRTDNPVLFAKRVKHKTTGHRTWSEEDIKAFRKRWPQGSPQRLAFEVLLFTGLRRSDAVRLGRQHLKDGCHVITTKKSGGTVKLEIPLHPTLRKHLESAPADHLTYIVTRGGHSRSEKAFTNWLREAAHKAGLPSNSSPHGLRKAACRRLAEAGCTPHQIMAITGHQNLAEVETYTKAVNQKRLAQGAMATIIDAFPGE
jgi:integrase